MTHSMNDKIEIDPEIIKDFMGEFADAYEELQRTLVLVDQYPGDQAQINQLFRTVHSIKSNLRMVALDPLSEIVHSLENILDDIRHQRLSYFQGINDILLITISRIRTLALQLFQDEDVSAEINKLNVSIQVLCMVEPVQLPGAVARVLKLIDPDQQKNQRDEELKTQAELLLMTAQPTATAATKKPVNMHPDIEYFLELVAQLELAQPHW